MKYLNKMILVLCILTIFFITAFNFNTYQSKYISSDIKVLESIKLQIQNYLYNIKNERLQQNLYCDNPFTHLEKIDEKNINNPFDDMVLYFETEKYKKIYTDYNLMEKFINEDTSNLKEYLIYMPIMDNNGMKGTASIKESNIANQYDVDSVLISDDNTDVLIDNETIFKNINSFLEEKQTKNVMLFYGKMNLGSFDTIVAYIQTENNLKYIMPIQSNASMIGLEQCKLYDANVFLP